MSESRDTIQETIDTPQLLVMAAYYEGARPGSRSQKCERVVKRTLQWMGLWNETTLLDMMSDNENIHINTCYGVLIEMIRHVPSQDAIFSGRGNFGSTTHEAARPPYTECRLTSAGAALAEKLLKKHPEFQAR